MSKCNFDVIVAGSGPAGSTASTLLAQQGYSTLMIDRDQHPRFHIGESLLPMSEPIFQRLGIKWIIGDYLPKHGAEFIDENTGQNARFPLAAAHQPYQVDRAKFDLMMVENAQEQGVTLHQNEAIKRVEIDKHKVNLTTDKAKFQARYLIDATGRSAMMGRKHNAVERIKNLGKFALYTHYKSVLSDTAKSVYKTGDVKILIVDIGWIWVIPLIGNRLSVGLVVHDQAKPVNKGDQLFLSYIESSPYLSKLLLGAEQANQIHAEADFSYSNQKRFGTRYACCGDAAGFIDPVFSSGVFLAMTSAQRVADRVKNGLEENTEADPLLHASDDVDYLLGFNSMLLFVERFYNHDLVGRLLFQSQRNHNVRKDIMGLLAGDLWNGNNKFQNDLLAGRQSRKSVC